VGPGLKNRESGEFWEEGIQKKKGNLIVEGSR